MSSQPVFILGFDPGGRRKFGWNVCVVEGSKLRYCKSGVANNAKAVMQSFKLPTPAKVEAAGIDAPMFWSSEGNRFVDDTIRKKLKGRMLPKCKGFPTEGGKVLQVNSLRGGALAQGPLLGKYLLEAYPTLNITEAHPTALLRLLNVPRFKSQLDFLRELIEDLPNEHQRDATIAAFAAWSMRQKQEGWRDLYLDEPCPVKLFGIPGSYWMPIP